MTEVRDRVHILPDDGHLVASGAAGFRICIAAHFRNATFPFLLNV